MRSRRRIDHVRRAQCSSGRDLVSTLLVCTRKGRNLRRICCNAICRLMAHSDASRQRSTSVAFGAKQTLTEPRLQKAAPRRMHQVPPQGRKANMMKGKEQLNGDCPKRDAHSMHTSAATWWAPICRRCYELLVPRLRTEQRRVFFAVQKNWMALGFAANCATVTFASVTVSFGSILPVTFVGPSRRDRAISPSRSPGSGPAKARCSELCAECSCAR